MLARQERAFKTRAVDISVTSSDEISLLEVDLRKPDFGLIRGFVPGGIHRFPFWNEETMS